MIFPDPPGESRQPIDKFDSGTYADDERTFVQATAPGANPRKAIADYMSRVKTEGRPMMQMAHLSFLRSTDMEKTFPGKLFYLVRFPQWPISYDVPPPLANNNVFVFSKTQEMQLITTSQQLEKFFAAQLHGIKDARGARGSMKTWLCISEELANDGMFKFNISDSSILVKASSSGLIVSGKAVVDPVGGNSGDITATIAFNCSGNVQDIKEIVSLQEGIRPICQSTKLLDADPLVRRMAQQDLLVMGNAALWYLENQRKTASPKLQEAIDEISERILLNGR